MSLGSPDLLGALLKEVSRSFYLTLRVLPRGIRRPIGLAYLLARASDTIADTEAVPRAQRLELLDAFQQRVLGNTTPPFHLEILTSSQASAAEHRLLTQLESALACLGQLSAQDLERVREVLTIIIGGQKLDVQRFGEANAERIVALETDEQLDDYTYRVAGCVGEFWTRMCRAHLFPKAPLDDALLLAQGIRFGKGLQLVNVLRDLPADLRLGRCYLPRASLKTVGLDPMDLLDAANGLRLAPLYARYLDLAESHLEAGWAYTNQLPITSMRVRLACAWPVLIGMKTLAKLRTANVLIASQRVKISRQEVRQVLWRSVLFYPRPERWRGLLQLHKVPHRNTLPRPGTLVK